MIVSVSNLLSLTSAKLKSRGLDPTPLGEKRDHQSLLPLITDLMVPPGPPTPLWCEPLEMLPLEMFQAARLDPGTKQEGVSNQAPDTSRVVVADPVE